jgi:hypothetical protein
VLAHRVGALGAIVAVIVLSVELVGALAWKHHVSADHERWALLHGTELSLGKALQTAPAHPNELDSTLERVTVSGRALER